MICEKWVFHVEQKDNVTNNNYSTTGIADELG